MSGMLLSCADFPIIKPIAKLLGLVMNLLYNVFDKFGIANIGLCIIVFTVIIKLLMIPMTIKQQKTTKLSSLMSPELMAVRNKYKGKTDNASMMAMNNETKAVYDKYGASPTGGCMPMLLQMCILLALYGVIYAIPTYVKDVNTIYTDAASYVENSIDEYKEIYEINEIMLDNKIKGFENNKDFNKILKAYNKKNDNNKYSKDVKGNINKLLSNQTERQSAKLDTSRDAWAEMKILKDDSLDIIKNLKNISDEEWKKLIDSSKDAEKKLLLKYSSLSNVEEVSSIIEDNYNKMTAKKKEISDVYTFAGIDLSRSPSQEKEVGVWWALLIPLLSAVTQWFSSHLATKSQPSMEDNPMASSLKTMNIVFPIMSAFFCYTFAAGLGLYWVIGSVFQIGQQFFINRYFEKVDVQDIIKANVEKRNKKLEKYGMAGSSISQAANYNAKSVKNDANSNNNEVKKQTTYKQGGIAAKANMVKEYNEKNNK